MEVTLEAILKTFVVESHDNLNLMEEALLALEASPDDEEAMRTILRTCHTLKGSASCLGFGELANLAHVTEDLLQQLQTQRLASDPSVATLLLQIVDALRAQVSSMVAGSREVALEHKALLGSLAMKLAATPTQDEDGMLELPEGWDASAAVPVAGYSVQDSTKTLRVDMDKLDHMLDLTVEIAIAQDRLRARLERLDDSARPDILDDYQDAAALYSELQEQVMQVRMVEIGPLFHQFTRIVRDMAAANGKIARLNIQGADVEVDAKVIENLKDPLIHMIRNSLDHGIETPAIRRSLGKDPCGQITVRAVAAGGSVVVELEDDGSGFSRQRIIEQAKARGIGSDLEKASDRDVYQLVLLPGFSTAESVTELSGRGIGMDVVRKNIESLNGAMSIESQEGSGAKITIRFPLTLAIIEGFLVGVQDETCVIPLDTVVECFEIAEASSSGVIDLRGEALPYLGLRRYFGLPPRPPGPGKIVVVQYDEGRAGLVVDDLYGQSQCVIKPLGGLFQNLPGISSSTILGTGRVGLILDVSALLWAAAGQQQRAARV